MSSENSFPKPTRGRHAVLAAILVVGSVWAFWPRQAPTDIADPEAAALLEEPASTVTTDDAVVWAPSPSPTEAPDTPADGVSGRNAEAVTVPETTANTVAEVIRETEPDPTRTDPMTRLTATPADTSAADLAALAAAVEARLTAETTGHGRDLYPETLWRRAPCCEWVELRALTADFSAGDTVYVIVEWATDRGPSSGPSWWTTDPVGNWIPAS